MSFWDKAVDAAQDAIRMVIHFIAGDPESEEVEQLYIDFRTGNPLPPHGVLKGMGYHVGKTGIVLPSERREILRRTFRVELVGASPSWAISDYIREWGPRCSPARLAKMDRVLGGLIAHAERKTRVDMSEAIRDWREDQKWLRDNGRKWPTHNHEQ